MARDVGSNTVVEHEVDVLNEALTDIRYVKSAPPAYGAAEDVSRLHETQRRKKMARESLRRNLFDKYSISKQTQKPSVTETKHLHQLEFGKKPTNWDSVEGKFRNSITLQNQQKMVRRTDLTERRAHDKEAFATGKKVSTKSTTKSARRTVTLSQLRNIIQDKTQLNNFRVNISELPRGYPNIWVTLKSNCKSTIKLYPHTYRDEEGRLLNVMEDERAPSASTDYSQLIQMEKDSHPTADDESAISEDLEKTQELLSQKSWNDEIKSEDIKSAGNFAEKYLSENTPKLIRNYRVVPSPRLRMAETKKSVDNKKHKQKLRRLSAKELPSEENTRRWVERNFTHLSVDGK